MLFVMLENRLMRQSKNDQDVKFSIILQKIEEKDFTRGINDA